MTAMCNLQSGSFQNTGLAGYFNMDFKDDIELIVSSGKSKSVTFDKSADNISTGLDECDEENATTLAVHTKLVMAATLINEARYGRHGVFKLTPKEVKLYNSYYTFYINYLIYVLLWFNLALAVFEKPAVSGYELPYWATMIMEYVCIFVFALYLFHRWYIAPDGCFWNDKKNIILTATIIITFLDMLLYSIFMENGLESKALRWSRILRPVFIVNLEGRQIRRAFRNIRRTIVGVVNVLVLLLFAIGLFALLATKLFENRNLKDIDGNPYFHNFLESYYQLYIFTTTANSPDVGIPAYDSNNWFALFFLVFLVICMYIFLSILLAVVYANYRKHLKNEVRKSVYRKRRQLKLAFDLICEKLNNEWVLRFERWKSLLQVVCPSYSPGKVSLLWHVLDRENNDYIKVKDFTKVSELLNTRVIEVKEEVHLFEKICPTIYFSWLSVKIRRMVCHRYFLYFFDVVIFVNAVFIALSLEMAEAAFLLLFNIELFLKFYTYGCREFFVNFWNTFDFFIIGGATIAFIVELSTDSVTASQAAVDFLMILRVLRMIKVMGSIESIFVAFIIEAFMLQYTFSQGKFESELEKVIQEKGVGIGMTPITERSRTGTTLSVDLEAANGDLQRTPSQIRVQEYAMNQEKRYRLMENQIKTAENLLQQMFEDEIGSEDMGPQTLNEIEELEPVEVDWKKMTFDTIG
ncbi:two pore calcium channel 1-like [Paramuricea clavata]|uniref:Two pore calcium channel 1-like n=1 Tax=Paramuricea clavata TaxID=317549 RepID=A0A6S7IFK8_PARCT|nr:two pore calcium channel 1-like [Paramuricea clavata]